MSRSRKIVVAVDFSDCSLEVVRAALERADPKVLVVPSAHRPSCDARSCASCQNNRIGAEGLLRAALEGQCSS